MYSFKPIRSSDISREEIEVHKTFTLGTVVPDDVYKISIFGEYATKVQFTSSSLKTISSY